jgi:glycosyltransferase involved in cell wall biosynthesis
MDISVIVPFHNEKDYIEKCVSALLGQDYPPDRYEIIMIDNNSTDGSPDFVKGCSRIKLLSESKPGAFAARNRGFAEARAPIIAFTDADCAPCVDWLNSIRLSMYDESAKIVQGRLLFADNSPFFSMLAEYESEKARFIFGSNKAEIYYCSTNNLAIRADLIDKTGLFSEIERGADVLFALKAIHRYSCNIAHYAVNMCVRHLEIENLWCYYQKLRLYGNDFEGYGKSMNARPLNLRERLAVCQNTIRKHKYSSLKSAVLFFLLSVGGGFYELGRRKALANQKGS